MPDVLMRVEGADAADLTGNGLHNTRHSIRQRNTYPPASSGAEAPDALVAVQSMEATRGARWAWLAGLVIGARSATARTAERYRAVVTPGSDLRVAWRAQVAGLRGIVSPTTFNALLLAVAVVVIAETLPGAWMLVGAVALGACIIALNPTSPRVLLTMLLCATVGVTSVDYLTWRFEVTNWAGWWIAVPLLAAEAFGAVHALGLQYTLWPRRELALSNELDPTRLPIYIFIPTVDEGVDILKPTLRAVKIACRRFARVYPGAQTHIIVCNDGYVANKPNWRETEALARQFGVTCSTRTRGGGAKAGNIEHARRAVGAVGNALIVIFDTDQQPKPDFLLKTIPPFADPTLAWVQTGQYYHNLEQPVAAWANDQQALFYRVLCPGKATQNAAFICGTNVVLRAAALDDIGGLPQDSVTEDFAASIQLHGRWKSIFLTDVLALGLGPMDLPAYLKQQRRWAIGTLGVLRTHWRSIFLPWEGELTFAQRIQYGLACTHYLCGLRDFIYIVAPLAFLATGVPAVRGADLGLFIWHFLPYWLASQAAFWYVCRGQTGLRGIIIGFGSFPALLMSLLTVMLGRRAGFMVTAKRRDASRSWIDLLPYAGLLLLCLAGLVLGFASTGRRDAVAVSMLWIAYSASLLSGFLWLAVSDLRYKEAPVGVERRVSLAAWLAARIPPQISILPSRYVTPRVRYSLLSIGLVLSGIAVTMRALPQPAAPAFVPTTQGQTSRYLGLSLRTEMLSPEPQHMDQMLCESFTIIGRTQDIQDNFSTVWADQLASEHATPWIVLEFGQFGANGAPPLSAGLLAIANGVQDSNIRRWADEIRAYGHPVYLTILLHVDRNWAVSSAVANGGIPQDSASAWLHVQSVFRAEGAKNVAWVWAPADPANDQAYAPPAQSIDVVLQSFIRYPGTPWPDVSAVLAADQARHPGKPLFVEVSAVGSPAEKSAWLRGVMSAVANDHAVYALLYHEGSPDLNASAADNKQWSLESDPLSIKSVESWRALTTTSQPAC